VIRREMNLSEGDAYNRVLVDRSKNQIKALGFFKDVDITETPGTAPDRTGLQVKVTEQPTGELSFSAGYSSIDRLVTDIGVTQRNFGGRGQDVRAEVSIGSLKQQVNLAFTEPRFLNRNLSAGVDAYTFRYDFTQYAGYESDSTGMDLRFGFPLSHDDKVVVSRSQCGNPPTLSPVICNQVGSTLTSAPGYTLRLDHRNDAINPTRGYFTQLSQDFAGFGGDVKYVKSIVTGGWYHGFTPSLILSITGDAGYVAGWGGDYVRINDRFFEGGNSFKGFEIAGIGPRDVNPSYDQALGAKFYAIGTIEQTFPDGLPEQYGIKTAAFLQFGTAGLIDNQARRDPFTHQIIPTIRDDMSLRASAGISIFWKSPLGPIEIDLSEPFLKRPYDKTQSFNFSTSTRF
jgi:outer membrane protein insertion porin family